MAREPVVIELDPESAISKALAEEESVVLSRNGVRYRVSRDDADPWANYDPERIRAALRRFAGTLTPEEGERLKELIYRGREEGTRPIDRP